ncbi:response regulator [Taibaiella koreensis]|uniref:response regulator n=1 Tax=Taibaiella koreensis TaxID=1268548 RepID=UPI000E59ED2B|nr:response regulator transcription factor [Taibaiella koreensis]
MNNNLPIIRLTITDDHPMVISGIRNMLHYYRHIEVADTYTNGAALMEGLKTSQPDILLLDLQLPDISGNELIRLIVSQYPAISILVITSMESMFHIKDAMKAGSKGYLLKTAPRETLLEAIETIYQGGEYLESSLKEQLLQEMLKTKHAPASPLTRREKEILQLIAKALTSAEIAATLSISTRTVENHRFSLMQKLNAKNTVGLIRVAQEKGFI